MLPLREDLSKHDVPGYFMAMLTAFNMDQPLTIGGVNKDCIAIYGGSEYQDGASLALYNTRFNVLQSKQYFKVYFNNARFWVIGKHILLAYGQTLACVAFRISKEQLSDMIGSQRSNEFSTIVDTDTINEEIDLEELFVHNRATKTQKSSSCAPENQKNSSQVDDKKPLGYETLDNQLRSMYRHNICVNIIRGDVLLSDTIQTQLSSNVLNDTFAIEDICLLTSEMEKCGASETEITDKCIPVLIKANVPGELSACLRRYTNVSDKMLVKSLKYFMNLTAGSNAQQQLTESKTTRQILTLNEDHKEYINIVLSCSFNEELIKQHLRTYLDFSEVISLLSYMYTLLESNDITLEEQPQFGDNFDDDLHLLDWFSTILDSHYQQFLLSRNMELSTIIAKWKQLVDDRLASVRDMKSLSSVLYNLVKGNTHKNDNPSCKWYSVEEVKLY